MHSWWLNDYIYLNVTETDCKIFVWTVTSCLGFGMKIIIIDSDVDFLCASDLGQTFKYVWQRRWNGGRMCSQEGCLMRIPLMNSVSSIEDQIGEETSSRIVWMNIHTEHQSILVSSLDTTQIPTSRHCERVYDGPKLSTCQNCIMHHMFGVVFFI